MDVGTKRFALFRSSSLVIQQKRGAKDVFENLCKTNSFKITVLSSRIVSLCEPIISREITSQ